jgi:hypothetical protein
MCGQIWALPPRLLSAETLTIAVLHGSEPTQGKDPKLTR